jgi:hypothetical protein
MSNLAFDRFLKQKQQNINYFKEETRNDENIAIEIIDNSPIIEKEVLKSKILEKLNPKPIIVMNQEQNNEQSIIPQIELIHFTNLFEFVHWYENNKDKFSENQIKPLDTLIEAKNMTMGGCNCDREKRKFVAEDYFRKFWMNNQTTDLLPTLLSALKTKKILFGNFLSYPA